MNTGEKLIKLDETYLTQIAELYKSAFEGEPRNDKLTAHVSLYKKL